MASKKKLVTSAVALGTAAALVLGGTFAWQSINQTVVNEGSNLVNPGGRLHDDFDGSNKDIYVENFASNDIYARIRLEEYFKIAMNVRAVEERDGVTVPKVDDDGKYVYDRKETELIGTTTKDDAGNVTSTEYVTFTGYDNLIEGNTLATCVVEQETTDEEGTTTTTEASYFTWTMGKDEGVTSGLYYMPTFNQNKDSLAADINGGYKFGIGEITSKNVEGGQYNEMVTYTADSQAFGYEIFDADIDTDDEVAAEHLNYIIESGKLTATLAEDECEYDYTDAIVLSDEEKTHTATELNTTKGLISMSAWLALLEGDGVLGADGKLTETGKETVGGYWVYDTDGWVYWSGAITAGQTTGRLMDGIELTRGMGDGWYYAINVVAQFITAGDLGQHTNTGFYAENGWGDTAKAPTENALKLLTAIGVNTAEAQSAEELATDWSALVTMRNITSEEYDKLVTVTGGDNNKMHWQNMYSWTNTIPYGV